MSLIHDPDSRRIHVLRRRLSSHDRGSITLSRDEIETVLDCLDRLLARDGEPASSGAGIVRLDAYRDSGRRNVIAFPRRVPPGDPA